MEFERSANGTTLCCGLTMSIDLSSYDFFFSFIVYEIFEKNFIGFYGICRSYLFVCLYVFLSF